MAEVPRDPDSQRAAAKLDTATDAELLEAAEHSAEAFAAFYRRHRWDILGYLAARTRGDTHLALDLTAEAFALACEKRHLYRAELGTGRAWLFGIAKNLLADAYRHRAYERSARQRLGLSNYTYTDQAIAQIEQLTEAADEPYLAELEKLPEGEREAVRARILEEQPYADIATAGSTSQEAVRQRVSRGLARLRRWRPRQ